jgi:hypothetical protein
VKLSHELGISQAIRGLISMSKQILVSLEDRYDGDNSEFVIPVVFKNSRREEQEQCVFEIIDRVDLNEAYMIISRLFIPTAAEIGIQHNQTDSDDRSASVVCVKLTEDGELQSIHSFRGEGSMFPREHEQEPEWYEDEYEPDDEETSDENH